MATDTDKLADRLADIENHVEARVRRTIGDRFDFDEAVVHERDQTVLVYGCLRVPLDFKARQSLAYRLRNLADAVEGMEVEL